MEANHSDDKMIPDYNTRYCYSILSYLMAEITPFVEDTGATIE
jgi:hypothetical protein